MAENIENEKGSDEKPRHSDKPYLRISLIIVVTTAILVGGSVYYLMKKEYTGRAGKLLAQIEGESEMIRICKAEKEMVQVEKEECEKKQKEAQNNQPETSQKAYGQFEKRLVGTGCYAMKDGQIDEFHFRDDFNSDPANIMIHYENKDFGVSFDVPYNKNWGNKDCVVLPYKQVFDPEKNYLRVDLGLFRPWKGDFYKFSISDRRNAEEIENEQLNIVGGEPSPDPRRKKIGNWDIVVYESYGMGTSRVYEVLGEKNNYTFKHSQLDDLSEKGKDSAELEKIIETFAIN